MTDQNIQNKQAFVVIDSNTMERISKFYSRKGDAERFIKDRAGWSKWHALSIAEFEYKTHYKIEESL